jgi:4-amino-4-deoxy-L-arabinose transferase-like glycosyltransferase
VARARSSSQAADSVAPSGRRERAWAALLLCALLAQAGLGLFSDGLTNDELIYIASGYRHLTAGDFALNTEQPPLAKLAAAVPLAFMDLREPPRTGDPWSWAFHFLQDANEAGRVIRAARGPALLLTLLLAVLVWRWARAVYGPTAGLFALALVAFHPSILAHGHLATTDVAAALTMTAASWAYWHWSKEPQPSRALLLAAAVGLALATRLTSFVLLPAFVLLETLALVQTRTEARPARLRAFLVLAAATVIAAPSIVWASYGFHYAPFPGESVGHPPGPELGLVGRLLAFALDRHLLPEAYLEGARFVAQHDVVGHPTYLLGVVSPVVGPWYYYLVALAVKNTPGFLAAAALAVAAALRREAWRQGSLVPHAVVPAALVLLAASAGRIQIGERYVLGVYPFVIVVAAGALARLGSTPRGRATVALLLGAHAVPVLLQAPRGYIPYFNLLAGGTDGGHRVLADSNLDWGQDLPRLASWMRAHGVAQVQLAYHGPDSPDRFGIVHEDLPGIQFYPPREPARPFDGTVVLSPNLLLGVFSSPGDDPYAPFRGRPPDDRAGVFFVYNERR